jgi:hypothetical protein
LDTGVLERQSGHANSFKVRAHLLVDLLSYRYIIAVSSAAMT